MSKYFKCPECGNSFESEEGFKDDEFCQNCGFPISWEENDEIDDNDFDSDLGE